MPNNSPTPLARSLRVFTAIAIFSAIETHSLTAAEPASASAEASDGWALVSRTGTLTIYKRPRKDSNIHEVKAVGLIEAAPVVIKRVLDDTAEYPRFMPYVIESRVISRLYRHIKFDGGIHHRPCHVTSMVDAPSSPPRTW